MIDNEELPIGFTMELAKHSDVLNYYAHLPEQEQRTIIEKARDIQTRSEMRHYVESIFKNA